LLAIVAPVPRVHPPSAGDSPGYKRKGIFLVNFCGVFSRCAASKWKERNLARGPRSNGSVLSAACRDDFGGYDRWCIRGAYEFSVPGVAEDFVPQHLAPGTSG